MAWKQAKTKAEFQSVQCLWLRASLKLSADQVALAIGWHPNSVRKLQARYFKEGEAALRRGGKGGRYYPELCGDLYHRSLKMVFGTFLPGENTPGFLFLKPSPLGDATIAQAFLKEEFF